MRALYYAAMIVLIILALSIYDARSEDEIYTLAHGNGFVELKVSGEGSVLIEENGQTRCYQLNNTNLTLIGYNNTKGTALEYALMFEASNETAMKPLWHRPIDE